MKLASVIAAAANRMDERLVRTLAAAVANGRITSTSTPLDLSSIDRGLACRQVVDLVEAWRGARPTLAGADLALALESCLEAQVRLSEQSPLVEVAWTGPVDIPSTLRQTAAVVHDLVDAARSYLLIVGYSITFDYLHRGATGRLLEDLVAASARGVRITMVLHDNPRNVAQLTRAWPVGRRFPTVLTWINSDPDDMTKLHAKVLVADGRDLLVTSANLTYHGLERNIELGLRTVGPQADVVRTQFDELQRVGLLRPLALPL